MISRYGLGGKSGYEICQASIVEFYYRQRSAANNHYAIKSNNWSDITSVALNHQTGYLPAKEEEVRNINL